MICNSFFKVDNQYVGEGFPTYFIADIAANHDGSLNRAVDLIHEAAEAGANAAKFQHFTAHTIVSDYGFKSVNFGKSHQSDWGDSVYQVYARASIGLEWTQTLREECKKAGITFFTSPYSMDLVDALNDYVPAYKIGSGDITWHEIIDYIAKKNKPVILATGASSMEDVKSALDVLSTSCRDIALLQCNTNYTASLENFKYIQLNVLLTYKAMYPNMVLGLSDHTIGHSTVLGAVALGAKIIEKHFTDDNKRKGPDHMFAMNPVSWREMVDRTRELEQALGDGIKKVEENEIETVMLQRRAIRLKKDIKMGDVITKDAIEMLRPCPPDALTPNHIKVILGKKTKINKIAGDYLKIIDIE